MLIFEGVILADNSSKTTKDMAELSEAIKLLDDSKNETKSLRTLNRLIRNNDQNISCRARASLSRFYRNSNKIDKAWEVVKECTDFDRLAKIKTSKGESSGYTEAFLEAAHCEASMKNTRESFKMLDYAESRTEGLDKLCSMKKYAEVLMMIEEPEKAGTYLKNALEYGRKYFIVDKEKRSPGETDIGRNNEAWLKLEKEIEKMIFDVEVMLLTREYGEGYGMYVKMRTLFDQKLFEDAKITSEEIIGKEPNSIYAEAAKLFHAYCQVETKNFKEAEKELLAFISEKPYGLYRGDAWMRLGRNELEDNWDSKKSSEYYKKALDWFKYMREKKDLTDIYTVPDKVKTISTPGGNSTYLNEWYSTKFRKIDPKEIVNHETAQWYMDENEKECLFMVGFFLFMEGNFPEAKDCFLKVKSVSKDLSMLEASKIPNTLMRLRGACDQGWLQTPPEHMNKFKGKYRLKLFLADLYWTVEKYSDAEQLYEDVINDGKAGSESQGRMGT